MLRLHTDTPPHVLSFEIDGTVTPEALVDAGVVRSLDLPVKILGRGELKDTLASAKARGTSSGHNMGEAVPN